MSASETMDGMIVKIAIATAELKGREEAFQEAADLIEKLERDFGHKLSAKFYASHLRAKANET